MESIPIIDLRLLSYADLTALTNSFSSPSTTTSPSPSTSTLSPSRSDDIVVPKIDRSIFNESAGSRKQTYSRLRLAPPKAPLSSPPSSSSRRRGRPRSSPSPSSSFAPPSVPAPSPLPDDACCWENRQILLFLRQLFEKNGMHQTLALANPAPASVPAVVPNAKKRGRRKKARIEEEAGAEVGDGKLLNAKGVEVDFVALGMKEDLFEEEIMKRTAGLATEEGLLGFMNRLEGKWATARKRRRIVDAGALGDGLPNGWKLLLALKRKDGKIWVHCRRYLSPSGKQFTTCKEVSRYMLSVAESELATNPLNVNRDENASLSADTTRSCRQATGLAEEDNYKMETTRFSSGHHGELGDLCKSPVLSSLECCKCNIKFPDKTTCDQHSLTCHSSSDISYGEPVSCNVMSETSEALPTGPPAELKPYSSVPVPLLSSQDMDLQIQSESFEALPHVGSAESRPGSFLDELSLSSSETKAENICENNNVANGICSSGVHQSSARLLDSVEIQMNGDDSYHLRSNLSNCATESDHCDSQSNKCNSTFKKSKNDTENFRKIDVDISNHVKGDSDPKTDLRTSACEMGNSSILDSAHRDSAETLDANIEENTTSVRNLNSEANAINARNVEMDINADIIYSQNVQKSKEGDCIADDTIESLGGNIEENHMALQNLNCETDTARDIHPNTHVDIDCGHNDQWSREADSPAKDTDDSFDGNTEENHRSPENPNRETDTFSIKDINMDTHADIDYDQNDQMSKKGELILSKNYGGSIDTWVTHYNSSYDNFQSVELNIAPNTAEESHLPDHGCRMEEAVLLVPEVSTNKSVDSLADNTMGGLLRNSSEMDSMHVFDAAYDKSFMMPSTSSVDPHPIDTPSLRKFDCINRINAKLGYNVESYDVGYRVCSDYSTINALETTVDVSGGDEVSTQNVLKENSHTINQLSNNAGLKVHASFRDQSLPSIGIVNPSDVTYTVKDLSICKVVDDTKNYHNSCKPNRDSDMSISAIWPPSTENELFASRTTDGHENPICNQQFYLEENLHALQGNGPSYNIRTGGNDIIASVVEEHRVAAVSANNYNREDDGLISGHRLSCGNPVANHFVHGNSRTEQGAKEGILPSSSGQGYGITSHMSRIFPCDVHDSFMCHSRNGGLGCSFSGSDKVPVVDISRIAGADIFGSAEGRQPPPWIQPSSYFSADSIVPHQDKNNRHYYTDKRHEHPMGFEGIRVDDYGPPGSSYLANQDSHIKSSQHLTFDYSGNIKNVYAPPVQLDWSTGTPHINAREEITIRCIWCGADFSQQGGAFQVQPDSIGFICPNCKAKISGQLKF